MFIEFNEPMKHMFEPHEIFLKWQLQLSQRLGEFLYELPSVLKVCRLYKPTPSD